MSRPDNNLEISGKRDEYSANAESESLKKPIEENSRMAQEGNKSNVPAIHVRQQICVPFKKRGTCPYSEWCRHVHTIGEGRGKGKYRECSAITIVNGESADVPTQDIGFEQDILRMNAGRYTTHSDIMESKKSENCTRLKTRLCTLWERDNRCAYGTKCLFAHGKAELKSLDSSNPPESRSSADISAPARNVPDRDVASNPPESRSRAYISAPARNVPDRDVASNPPESQSRADISAPARNVPNRVVASNEIVTIAPADRRFKWNDIQRISRIYGDWIE
ncbi:zinc finger CCCH domain-containing protein 39-like [Solanum dulcamara]|uniref:zinc finger CCCH domain-containing protein 39-like n=1 Tax=Solanum dulcamara TaxID=45834 RepID=UPI002485E25F|nr:zinc finger CCCH domain-containing protein 39-like [Solanum dulcamara]